MESLNELFFKFSNKTLIVILNKDIKPWFNASHIARILKYKRPNDAIRQLVEREYIKNFRSNKEHYIITLYNAIKIIKLCIKLTKSKLISEDKCYKKFINKSSRLKNNIYKSNINFIFDLDINDTEQISGYINNNQQSSNNILYNYEDI